MPLQLRYQYLEEGVSTLVKNYLLVIVRKLSYRYIEASYGVCQRQRTLQQGSEREVERRLDKEVFPIADQCS